MVATASLYMLLSLGALLFIAACFNSAVLPVAIFLDVTIVIALIFDYLVTPKGNLLTVYRRLNNRLSIGRENEITLTIISHAQKDLVVRLRDDFPPLGTCDIPEFLLTLPKSSKVSVKYQLTPTMRGNWQFHKSHLRYLSNLRLFWRQLSFDNQQTVKVYNDLKLLNELSIKLSRSTELGELKRRKRGSGTEFASLKEYQVGDDGRFIDWKATARRHNPVVRTFDVEHDQNLIILVDAGRMMFSELDNLTRFDHALNSALALALTGLTRGDQVGLGVFADKPLCYLPPVRGKASLNKMLDLVFDLKPRAVEPDYSTILTYYASKLKGRALIVLLTDLTDPTGSQALLTGLQHLTPRHLPFCVTLKDKKVDELAVVPCQNEEDVYTRVAALDLQAARELAFSTLNRQGCLTLDCPPDKLTTKLISQYLDIKDRGQL